MAIARLMANICSQDLAASRNFYRDLLDLRVTYDSDWFVQLKSPDNAHLELGILQQSHPLMPAEFYAAPQGCYLTFVVNDVDTVYARAQSMNLSILQTPKDEFYGQRRMLLTDPNGLFLDVSSPIADYQPG